MVAAGDGIRLGGPTSTVVRYGTWSSERHQYSSSNLWMSLLDQGCLEHRVGPEGRLVEPTFIQDCTPTTCGLVRALQLLVS